MGIFRRPRDTSPSTPLAVAEFWEWWSQARPTIESALSSSPAGDGLSADIVEELSRRVHKIHPRLQWEVGGGDERPASLTLTGGGDPELRGLAERWSLVAPDDGGWHFHPSRQADPEMLTQELVLGDHEFDLEYVRFGMRADQARARVHVLAYHPDFLFVSDEQRLQVAVHVLDWALGEDDVARWIGDVSIATEAPMDALPPGLLPSVVEQITENFDEPAWLEAEYRTPRGHPARLSARFPLHRQDYPLCDLHVSISVPYAKSNPDRLPVEPSASALREFEKKLTALGDRAVLAVRQTGDGLRVFTLYADPDSGVISDLDQLAAAWPEGKAKVESASDPAWSALSPFRP
ncbi:DUF695 domain-containing protein [Spirillospora sp. CA-294931]|uniref:DUF695 domain-containing protein n=1 Tax=Spirillospora sp. CA-294931 TaxID=3240042 RepID=UPI003D9460A6